MKYIALCFFLGVSLFLTGDGSAQQAKRDEKERAIAAIKKLGGTVTFDHRKPGKPVFRVDLDATKITDKDLKHLKPMVGLKQLFLKHTRITDKGLKHLKGLTNLQSLDLESTRITDKGLEHLKGLAKLRSLDLEGTRTTNEGVKRLRKAIPRLNVICAKGDTDPE
jgi:hypothetical protein